MQKRNKKNTPQKKKQNAYQITMNNSCNQQFLKNTPYIKKSQNQKIQKQRSRSITPSKTQRRIVSNHTNKKQQTNQSKFPTQLNSNQANLIMDRACQNLYMRGKLQAKALQDKRIKRQQEKQKQEEQQLSFKPKINQVSEKIIEFRKQTGTMRPKNPNRAKKQLAQKFYQELKECTFTPQINQISKIIVHNREAYRTENQHFNQLFNNSNHSEKSVDKKNLTRKSFTGLDSQIINKKSKQYLIMQRQLQEKQLFKPKLNQKSIQRIVQPFNIRYQKALQNKQKIRQGDYKNDQYSFQPKVGRSPYYQFSRGENSKSNKQNMPVWDQLYKESQNRVKQKQKLQNKNNLNNYTNTTNSRTNFQSLNHTNSTNSLTLSAKVSSNLYYQNLVQKRINFVFQQLDSDGDGLISPHTIGIQNLNKNFLIFLKPIFEQMDELNAELNYNQFKKAVINLLNDSDPYRKGLFLSQAGKKKENQNNFIPQINARSKQFFQGRNRSQIHVELYQQGLKDLQRKEFYLQRERAKKQQKQLEQCSFKPSLKLGGKNYRPHIFDKKLEQMQQEIRESERKRGLFGYENEEQQNENYD